MDRGSWRVVLNVVKRASRQMLKSAPPARRPRHADWLIVAMLLWAAANDRCPSWACDRRHYNGIFRPRKRLPGVSQFNRRMNYPRTRAILQRVHEELAGPVTATALSYLDGKPLLVGVASKDPDARRGHVLGGYARGYKLHAWMSEDRRIPLWCVTPLNAGEPDAAKALLAHVRELSERSLRLVDQNYDTHDLHKWVDARNGRLLVHPKGPPGTDSRDPANLRRMGGARRELLDVAQHAPSLLRMVHVQRVNAEGIFGNLCGYGGGLTGLPPWVRRLPRVRRWVGAKIILYHARLRVRKNQRTAA